MDFGASHQLESLLVARHGVIVVEAFYAPFPAGVKHRTNSVTKSVIGALVAIALEERRLESPDQRVVDFFPDRLIANLDDRKKAITIQNLLDMRSGLDWTEPLTDEPPRSMFAMERSANWAQFVLDQPMAANPGATFLYDSGNSHLLSAILTQATGESALDYAQKRLFGPLGISDVFWRHDPQGVSIGGYGLFLQPRDMAKLGYLYLRNGAWNGAQIIPPGWIDRIRNAASPTGTENFRYSNHLWVDQERGAFFARGYHGQHIFVMPAQDIVAVVTAAGNGPSGLEIMLIANAVRSDKPLPPDPAAQSVLAKRVREAATEKPMPIGERPVLTKTISGKVYCFSENPLRLESLMLRLDGPDSSYAYVVKPVRPSAPAESFEGPIGLEGLYRTGLPRPQGTIPAARGRWQDDRTFLLQFEDLGGDNRRIAVLSFSDNNVEVTSTSNNGLSAKAHGEAAD